MKSFKDRMDKFAQATEEKLNEMKTAIQQKLNENDKKPEPPVDSPENAADLLQGWTLLGGDRGTRNKNIEFDPSDLQPSADDNESLEKETSLAHDDAGDAHTLPKQGDGSLEDIPLMGDDGSEYESDSRNNSLDYNKLRISQQQTTSHAAPRKVSGPFEGAGKSQENVGFFFLLNSAIIWNILSLVDAYDLCQLSRTSAHFFKLATNEFLWERLYIKVFRKDTKVDKALWYEQLQHGGYRAIFGTKLCEEQMAKTVRALHNQGEHNAVEWFCKPLVSVSNFFSSTEAKLVMFGLDGSGKTSILYKLVRGENVRTEHTVGFNHEQIEHKGYKFDIWDLEHKSGNQYEFWKTYFPRTNGIIFVVDGTAPELLPQARQCLELFISAPQLADLPLLVYVNKRDVVESLSTLQVLVGLNLHYLCNKSGWHIQPCSTKESDYSLEEGLDWFCDTFQQEEVQKLKTRIVS